MSPGLDVAALMEGALDWEPEVQFQSWLPHLQGE